MVQIGNFHIGKAETAVAPKVALAGASMLWETLLMRYDAIELTQIYLSYVHDPDLKIIITTGLQKVLERQVNQLEEMMNKFKIPLPERPPKSSISANSALFEDRFIFRQLFWQVQSFFSIHLRSIFAMVIHDELREMFINFLKDETDIFNDLCKYGKLKGWLYAIPIYNPLT